MSKSADQGGKHSANPPDLRIKQAPGALVQNFSIPGQQELALDLGSRPTGDPEVTQHWTVAANSSPLSHVAGNRDGSPAKLDCEAVAL